MDALTGVSTRHAPQTRRADTRQVQNNAGGYVFELSDLATLRRFLTLGIDGGTYYTSASELAAENAAVVFGMAERDSMALVDEIVKVSTEGRAPKANPAIFALAIAASHGLARGYALSKLPQVCRTGTHLFLFVKYVEQFRGWGPSLRSAVADWYLRKRPAKVAFQAAKYRQREGWSHRDILRLAHPVSADPAMRSVFDWICRETYDEHTPAILEAWRRAQDPDTDLAALIASTGLSWEMLPNHALSDPEVWEALLTRGMPMTALIRQLPRLTRLDLLPQIGGLTPMVVEQLTDADRLRAARVHPVNVLVAQRTYLSGHSARGKSSWIPTPKITDALDAAFYAAYGAVEPAGKRLMLALDVSGSMGGYISDLPLSCREASAALALVQMATEEQCTVVGFSGGTDARADWWRRGRRDAALTPLPISPRQRLDDAVNVVSNLPFGATDCALPVATALVNRQEVDCFVVYTDNETWAGRVHPHQVLREYRETMGIDARMVVVGMTSTGFSIADPDDPLSLDIAGFDAAVPALINGFAGGTL